MHYKKSILLVVLLPFVSMCKHVIRSNMTVISVALVLGFDLYIYKVSIAMFLVTVSLKGLNIESFAMGITIHHA